MVVRQIIQELEKNLDRTEAFLILEHVLNMSKNEILIHLDNKVNDDEEKLINNIVERRLAKEPLQYVIHAQYFFGNKFYVNENVLIPRADTEILVEEVLRLANNSNKILDLCTGSGCIAISLKKANNNLEVIASDISKKALTVAMLNAQLNRAKVNFLQSDLFENINEKFDIIVSNPPYIRTSDICKLQDEVKFEPHIALDGGNEGLDYYIEIIEKAKKYLLENGLIALEIGYNQANEVSEILKENGYKNIRVIKDYGNNDRVVIAKTM